MQEMKLASHLMAHVCLGTKEMTIRKGVRKITVGEELTFVNAEDPEDTQVVFVIGAELRQLRMVPDSVAQEDGFEHMPHLYEGLKQFYPDITLEDIVTIVRFTVE